MERGKEGGRFLLLARCSNRQIVRRWVTGLATKPDPVGATVRAWQLADYTGRMYRAFIDNDDRMPRGSIAD